jgi:hypothetical protein
LSLLVAVPRVIQKATDTLPRNPIPFDLLLNRDAGILVVNKDGSINTVNVDNIKRDALGAPLYRTGCGGVLAATTATTTTTTTIVSDSDGTTSLSPLAANPSSAPVKYGACRSHTVCASDCPLRIQGDAYFVPIVQKQQAEVDRLTAALLAAQQKPEDDILTMITNDPTLFDFDVSMPFAGQPLPAPGSGGDLPAAAATDPSMVVALPAEPCTGYLSASAPAGALLGNGANSDSHASTGVSCAAGGKSLSAPSYAAVVSGSAAAPARVTAVKSTAPTTAPTNTTGGGSVDLSREEAMHSHVRGGGYDSNITEQEQGRCSSSPIAALPTHTVTAALSQ